MADISDVNNALVALLLATLYPNGQSQPCVTGAVTRVFAGWPLPDSLDADLAAGVVNVSVFPQPGMERNTTRYPQDWVDQTKVAATITGSVSRSVITLAGSVTTGHYVSVILLNKAFSYACRANDTLATVAAALAALINPVFPCFASGPAITIYGQSGMTVRSAAPGTVIQEVSRSNQRFMLTVWAPSNDLRVATARLIRPALDSINFIALADTSEGRVLYECSNDVDNSETANLYRRDTIYWVEYPVTNVMPGYPITIPVADVSVDFEDIGGAAVSTYEQIS